MHPLGIYNLKNLSTYLIWKKLPLVVPVSLASILSCLNAYSYMLEVIQTLPAKYISIIYSWKYIHYLFLNRTVSNECEHRDNVRM